MAFIFDYLKAPLLKTEMYNANWYKYAEIIRPCQEILT